MTRPSGLWVGLGAGQPQIQGPKCLLPTGGPMTRQPGCCQWETMVVASYLVPEPQARLALLLLGHLSCGSAGDARQAWSVLRSTRNCLPR